MPPTLTDIAIGHLGSGMKRSESLGKGRGALVAIKNNKGVVRFIYRYQSGGEDRTEALGIYSKREDGRGISLKTARDRASELSKQVRDAGGLDLFKSEQARIDSELRSQIEAERKKGSFEQMLVAYCDNLTNSGAASATDVFNTLQRHVIKPFPELMEMKAKAIGPSDIKNILARMVSAGIKRKVNQCRAYLSAAFNYAARLDNDPRHYAADGVHFAIQNNPVALIPVIREFEEVGNRHLNKKELALYWRELDKEGATMSGFLKLSLLLGGQRMRQLLRATWDDMDSEEEVLTLYDGKGRTREKRPHLLPILGNSNKILKTIPRYSDTSYIFSLTGKVPMNDTTASKRVSIISRRLTDENGIELFTYKDLRRTTETMLSSIGIDKETRAQILSHGRMSGVQNKHYDRYSYLNEKRVALEKWESHLMQIVEEKELSNVVSFPRTSS